MKNLKDYYQILLIGFVNWVETLGYSNSIQTASKAITGDFLMFLQSSSVKEISLVKLANTERYLEQLKVRENRRLGGGLTGAYINKHISILKLFGKFLMNVHGVYLPVKMQYLSQEKTETAVLTVEEVKSLFEATDETVLGYRDRMMLAVYYGCGLRRTEGVKLTVRDVLLHERVLIVRSPKNKVERKVPIATSMFPYFYAWLVEVRPYLLVGRTNKLFLTVDGAGLKRGESLYLRLKYLQDVCDSDSIKYKDIGLHTLRHSIATHLLHNGMKLSFIQRFLGHSTRDSTAIYTHIEKKYSNGL